MITLDDIRFTEEAAKALGGPAWLIDQRVTALGRLSTVAPATEHAEDWRYGRIDELETEQFALIDDPPEGSSTPSFGPRARHFVDGIGAYSALVHVVDGYLVGVTDGPHAEKLGLTVASVRDSDRSYQGLGELMAEVDEPFAVLNEAFASDITVIDIPTGSYVADPIVVISEISGRYAPSLSFPRTFIRLNRLSEASIISFSSSDDGTLLTIPATEIVLDNGSHLRYSSIQHLGDRAWQLGYQLAKVGRDASLTSFAATLGGDYSRLYSKVLLDGENSESQLLAAYLGTGTQVQEFRTFQEHVVGRTKSDLVFKGAVADTARSVYSGTIHMHKGARRAVASQTNRNLVLGEGARADSVPNLDIEENDVQCSHASAVGPIDPEQLFYLESRGIPPEVAERLILLGFFDDLLARVQNEACAEYVRNVVVERLAIAPVAAESSR